MKRATSLPGSRRQPTIREWIPLLLIVLFVVAYKSNDAISNPQFWAEDALVFFQEQFGKALPQLFSPYAGYLHTLPRIIAWVATAVPATHAPLVYNASAVLISGASIAFVCRRLRAWLPPWFTALTFLAVPTNGEIFGSLTNVHWFLQFVLAAYCLTPRVQSQTTLVRSLQFLGVFLISITGPFSLLLVMVMIGLLSASWIAGHFKVDPFGGALARFSSDRDWVVLAALLLGAVVQALTLSLSAASENSVNQPLFHAFKITFGLLMPIHTFGSNFLNGKLWLLLHALLAGILVFNRRVDGQARLVVLGFIAFAAITTLAPVARSADPMVMTSFFAGDRYFYLIKVTWWWAVLVTLRGTLHGGKRSASFVTAALVCMIAVTNMHYLRRGALPDMAWAHHARALDAPGKHRIHTNPAGWSATVEASQPGPPEQ